MGVGLLLLILAISGGPVKGLGLELPELRQLIARVAVGCLGGSMILAGTVLWARRPGPLAAQFHESHMAEVARDQRPQLTPRFVGRKELLRRLEEHLRRGTPTVLTGLGGVGKTQAALAYVDQHERTYELVWWLRAEEHATLVADYAALASRLRLVGSGNADLESVRLSVRSWLERHHGWLLIFDNAEDVELIKDFLPASRTGHVLLTSRLTRWPEATTVPVGTFRRAESLRLLGQVAPGQDEVCDQLAHGLGDLPLALEQAVAYLQEAGISPADYLALVRARADDLVGRGVPASYEETVATTWAVSLKRVERESAAARQLLTMLAFLAADGVPRSLMPSSAAALPTDLAVLARDPLAYADAVGVLARFSLVTATPDELGMHRLVQLVVRGALSSRERRRWAGAAVQLVQASFPENSDDPDSWEACASLLPHGLAATEHAEALQVEPELTARLLNRTGVYLENRAEFDLARRAHERARDICDASAACEPMTKATNLNNLGHVYYRLARWKDSQEAHEAALELYEAALGPDHPRLAEVLNRLGGALFNLGDMGGARAVYERAFRVCSAANPHDAAETATCLNNLGIVLRDMGELEEARELLERALAYREEAFHDHHPEIARSLNNLGMVMRRLGDHRAARALHERALAIHEDIYGDDHPTLAVTIQCLGLVDSDENELPRAESRLGRALAIFEQHHAPDHWLVRECRAQYDDVLQRMGR
jgi:tetratricopeptide (TPR) repeat protein